MAGWNKPSAANQPVVKKGGTKSPSVMKGVIVGAAAVVVGVVCIFAFSGKSEKPVKDTGTKPTKIKEVTPAPAPVYKDDPNQEEKPKVDPAVIARRDRRKNMTPEERAQETLEYMRSKPFDLTPTTNKPFRTSLELGMARIFMTEPGDPPPPPCAKFIAIQDEAHLAEILIANNPQLASDSQEVKDAKKMVELAKQELRQYIKDGGDTASFMEYYYGKLVDAHEQQQMAKKEIMRLVKEDPDLAESFYHEVNKKLEAKGIKGVYISEKFKERNGWQK